MSERLIRLRLSAWMVQLVWAALEQLSASPDQSPGLSPEFLPAGDDDLREAWRQSLGEQLENDFDFLRKTLVRLRSNGIADLDARNAEAFLRAATAVRLNLQHNALADLPDRDLQTDSINVETLPEAAQPAYACYLLLADIQGQVIAQIEQYENAPSAPLSEYPDGFFQTYFEAAPDERPAPPSQDDNPDADQRDKSE